MKSNKSANAESDTPGVSLPAATIMLIVLFAVVAYSAQQPNKTSQPPQPNDRFEYMSRELSLTPDQKPKVKAIVDAQVAEWNTLEKNKTLNGKQKIARMQEINQSAQSKIGKILTAEQNKKLTAIMDADKPRPMKPAPNRKPKAPPGPREP